MGDVLAQVRRAATAEALTHRWVWRLAAMITFGLLTTLGGYLEVPLPGTQVPVTLQTLFVSLSGLLLGPRLGAGAMALYVAAGVFQLRPATFAACTAIGVLLWTAAVLAGAWWLP